MARTNVCKECGWNGPETQERNWVGTNHNLCSVCAAARPTGRAFSYSDSPRGGGISMRRLLPVAMLAALAFAPHRTR